MPEDDSPHEAHTTIGLVDVTTGDLNRSQLQRAFALTLVHTLFPATTAGDSRRIAEWIVKGGGQRG